MAQAFQSARVFDCIDQHQPQHLNRLLELIRVPSISAENRGMTECAELLASYYRDLGCQRVEIVPTEGHPVVYAEYDAGKPVTLLVYFMYDVKQITGEEWTLVRDPFDPQVVARPPFRRCLVGRGAVNQKGPLGAFLNAVESIRATGQELPVNLKFISDGEEEIGSPRLVDFATAYMDRLRGARAAIFPTASQNLKGVPMVALGCKGSAPFELECSGALWGRGPRRFDIHSSNAAMVESPAWRLIQALATMTDPAHPDRITVDDFYDDVLPPAVEDVALVDRMAPNYDEESAKQVLAVDRFIDDVHGRDALMKLPHLEHPWDRRRIHRPRLQDIDAASRAGQVRVPPRPEPDLPGGTRQGAPAPRSSWVHRHPDRDGAGRPVGRRGPQSRVGADLPDVAVRGGAGARLPEARC